MAVNKNTLAKLKTSAELAEEYKLPKEGFKKRNIILTLLATDIITLWLSLEAALYLRYGGLIGELHSQPVAFLDHQLFIVALIPLWLVIFYLQRLYDYDALFWGSGEFSSVLNSSTYGIVIIIMVSYFTKYHDLSRLLIVMSWLFSFVLVSAGRLGIRTAIFSQRKQGKLQSRTLLVGDNGEAKILVDEIKKNPASGLRVVGYVGAFDQSDGASGITVPFLGPTANILRVIKDYGIESILIASSRFRHYQVLNIIKKLRGLSIDVHVSSGLYEILTSRVMVKELCSIPYLTIKSVPLSKPQLVTKRVFDLLVATVISAILSPLFVVLAAIVKLTSEGTVLYKQIRVGKNGKPFAMYKFRSMVNNAHQMKDKLIDKNEADGLIFKIKDDPRVTWIGRWIRRFSIDEFPQLINVFKGEMSLVGPRPPLPEEVRRYNDWHRRRLEVTPGMTGLWQIRGRSELSFDDMIKLDLYYIENWSLRLDLKIMFKTIPTVLGAKGSY